MRLTRTPAIGGAVFLLLILLYALVLRTGAPYQEAASIGVNVTSFQELSDRFKTLADQKGALYAFDVLRIAPLPSGTDLHLLGHVVGDELYKQKGILGIEDCTQDFRNACSHSIVIGALNEFGTGDSTVEKIRDACAKAPGGLGAYTMCFHGLGHGVFAYFGYDIPKTVAFCKRLGTEAHHDLEYQQCVGGMIMELIDGGGHDHDEWVSANEKYLDVHDQLSPCDRALIPTDAKDFCYTYLTPNLFRAAGADLTNPDPATFPRAFAFCTAISESDFRTTCYGSFGKEFIPLAAARDTRDVASMSNEQFSEALIWCDAAPNANARGACIGQEVESVFWGGENDPQASFRLCGLLRGAEDQDACYRTLATDIARYIDDPVQHAALCNELAAPYLNTCERTDTSTI